MPARTPNPSHVLTPEHREQLKEWFVSGLTPNGVQSQMEQYNRESAARGLAPFPSLNLSTIRYHYKRMKNDVDRLIREEIAREQLSGRKGLRDRDERIRWLEYGAEKLIPHLGSATGRGEFTAAETFIKYMEQIKRETDPRTGGADAMDPSFVRGLSTEQVKKIIADRKAAAGGTPRAPKRQPKKKRKCSTLKRVGAAQVPLQQWPYVSSPIPERSIPLGAFLPRSGSAHF